MNTYEAEDTVTPWSSDLLSINVMFGAHRKNTVTR